MDDAIAVASQGVEQAELVEKQAVFGPQPAVGGAADFAPAGSHLFRKVCRAADLAAADLAAADLKAADSKAADLEAADLKAADFVGAAPIRLLPLVPPRASASASSTVPFGATAATVSSCSAAPLAA